MTNMKKEYSILVNSCDAYSDVWPLFFEALKLYWPKSSNLNIYLNCESVKKINDFDVIFLNFKNNSKDQWGQRFIHALNKIDDDFLLILLDDYILEDYIDEAKLDESLCVLKNNTDIAACYLTKTAVKSSQTVAGFCKLDDYENYRLNTGPALWRKTHLLSLLKNVDNPWAWEVFGSYRTFGANINFIEPLEKDIYKYASLQGGAIYRGKWVRSVVEKISSKTNIKIDAEFEKRGFSDELVFEKRSIGWKLNFMILGFRMVGWKIIYFLSFYIKRKMKGNS